MLSDQITIYKHCHACLAIIPFRNETNCVAEMKVLWCEMYESTLEQKKKYFVKILADADEC